MSVGSALVAGRSKETEHERPVRVDFRTSGAPFAAVFIHGFLGRADATWSAFPRLLIENSELASWDVYGIGYASTLRLDVSRVWAQNGSLEILGYYLRTALAHAPFDKYRKLAVIAHSMGGLIAQQALVDAQTRTRVTHLFLFGTPSAGTRRALFARGIHAQARDMAEGSPFITKLRAAWSPILRDETGLKLRVVAAERDLFVPPHSSLGPFAEATRFVVPGNHFSIVKPHDASSLAVQLVVAGLLDRDAALAVRQAGAQTPTFLFTDVEASTQRWERHPQEMGAALRRQEASIKNAIANNGGHIFKTVSDKVCAVFSEPARAVAAAVGAQRSLAAEDFAAVDGIFVRMAVHRGNAEERDGDFYGGAINRITRILPVGHGGQILVSGVTAELARPLLPADVTLKNLGMHRLRDLADAEEIYQVDAPQLRHEFPALRSLDTKPNNLPAETNAFIGRDTELREVRALIKDYRLVSLVGTGGVGKTRLSLHAAVDMFDSFPDGIWFVEFGAVTDPALVWTSIATALGLTDAAQRSEEKLLTHLKARSALLLLDNCEHLIEAVAAAAEEILRRCPSVHVLCTSREPLRVGGERVYRMPSLPSASAVESLDPQTAMTYGSIALFVDRAQSVQPQFALRDDNTGIVAAICRRLDGIALAIELAAARVGSVPLASLLQRVEKQLLALAGGSRIGVPRQQTMRSMIDWSYSLLSERERRIFSRLAIFAGGFTLEAGTSVCVDTEPGLAEFEAVDLVTALVDKSLVTMETRSETTRYRLLEPIREFARDRLAAAGELDSVASVHARYYRRLIEGADGIYWLDDASSDDPVIELGNLRAAMEWTLAEKHDVVSGAAIAGALMRYWFFSGDEGRRWADVALQRLIPGSAPEVEARLKLGVAQLESAPVEGLREAADAALDYYRDHGDSARIAECLYHAAMTIALYYPEERERADVLATESVEIAQRIGAPRLLTLALRAKAMAMNPKDVEGRLGVLSRGLELTRETGAHPRLLNTYLMQIAEVEFAARRYHAALDHGLQALHESRRAGHTRALTFVKANLAHYAVMTGDTARAREYAVDALNTSLDAQDAYSVTVALNALAAVEAIDGNAVAAAKLLGFCNARFGRLHPPRQDESCEDIVYREVCRRLADSVGEERLAQMLEHGRSITLEQALRVLRAGEKPT